MGERDEEPDQEAGGDDAGEDEPRGDRGNPREPERQPQLLAARRSEIDRHVPIIGTRPLSLERVTRRALRGLVARASRALRGHEKTAMRALEPLVPRAFGEQLAVEGLLAVWADNHLRSHVPITRKPHFWFRGGVACDADPEAVPASPVRPSKPG